MLIPARPLIGITVGEAPPGAPVPAVPAAACVDAVAAAGGLAVLLPPQDDAAAVARAAVARLDGLLLPGGGDVEPWRFGESRHPLTGPPDPRRDQLEIALCRAALAAGLPLLAVCRGIQVLNVACGGTLVQDLPRLWSGALPHRQAGPRDTAGHTVEVAAGTRLASLTGAGPLEVNSFHHQAVGVLAPGLAAAARSPDGVVEAIEAAAAGGGWLLGVQWHPEDLWRRRPVHGRIFSALVAAAALWRRHGMA